MQVTSVGTEAVLTEEKGRAVPQLVREAQNGDIQAFEQLYRDHVGRVYALCLRISARASEADELTQDVFVRVWQVISSFRGESAFSSWLHRLAVNVVLTRLRSDRRRTSRVRPTDDLHRHDGAVPEPVAGTTVDLEMAISSLPRQARAVFVLHDIEGYRHEEIARLMGISTGTAKSQLHRARKLLREVLES